MTSQATISRVQRGHLDAVALGTLERITATLDARLDVEIRWNGERLDRLLDEQHARLVEGLLRRLRFYGWTAVPEVSFSIYGERGSVDILAFHPTTRSCLVVEVKSVVPDVQAMLAGLDRKRRLAPRIARDRGWEAGSVSTLLAVADSGTTRRRISVHAETFTAAFPHRSTDVRRWLRAPSGSVSGLLFVPGIHGLRGRHASLARGRVRVPTSRSDAAPQPPRAVAERRHHSPSG